MARDKALRLDRRRLLRGGLALASLSLLTGCGLPPLPWQQPSRVHRIGYLANGPPSPTSDAQFAAFKQAMRDLGYVEGQDFLFEVRRANGDGHLAETVAELMHLQPEVIVAPAVVEARAAQAATTTVPIVNVGVVGDLVAVGLAASLARPGGNLTGLSTPVLANKQLQLLKEAVPTLARVAVMIDQTRAADFEREAHEAAAHSLGLRLQIVGVDGAGGLGAFFESAIRERADGLYLAPVPVTTANQTQIAQLAMSHRLPSIAQQSDAASRGQLMAYGPNRNDLFRRAATYVDKILKGAKPADLPIEQPTKFDFGINLQTAQALGLTIPPSVLAQATELIQ
jgi:putative tryptophan/tyrosine transport system substrate-binding protein